jgi:hypothetical protein
MMLVLAGKPYKRPGLCLFLTMKEPGNRAENGFVELDPRSEKSCVVNYALLLFQASEATGTPRKYGDKSPNCCQSSISAGISPFDAKPVPDYIRTHVLIQ